MIKNSIYWLYIEDVAAQQPYKALATGAVCSGNPAL
jgi:hypothetical protein